MRPPEAGVCPAAVAAGGAATEAPVHERQASIDARVRAMILLASATEMSAPDIARLYLTDASHVRKVIHDFNERGLQRWTPTIGAGAHARRRPSSATGSSRSRVPAPIIKASH